MPTYEYECPEGHQFEIYCSISSKPENPPCPVSIRMRFREDKCEQQMSHGRDGAAQCDVCPVEPEPCELPARQVFLTPPTTWIPGVDHKTVLDYPGSKAHKAGHVHSHGFKYATKVSSGAGGMINPRTSAEAPIVNRVIPDYKTSTKRRLRKEGLL